MNNENASMKKEDVLKIVFPDSDIMPTVDSIRNMTPEQLSRLRRQLLSCGINVEIKII